MSAPLTAESARGVIAHSGLVIALAFTCLLAPIMPGLAVRLSLGALLAAAAGLALLIAPVANHAGGRRFRIAWPVLTAVAGLMLMSESYLSDTVLSLGLAIYLASQGVMLFLFASRARRAREIGGPALTFEGLISIALAALTLAAFPFHQSWILGAVIGVGLLDYASALAFIAMEVGLRGKAIKPL